MTNPTETGSADSTGQIWFQTDRDFAPLYPGAPFETIGRALRPVQGRGYSEAIALLRHDGRVKVYESLLSLEEITEVVAEFKLMYSLWREKNVAEIRSPT